jgi:hypothetical protein
MDVYTLIAFGDVVCHSRKCDRGVVRIWRSADGILVLTLIGAMARGDKVTSQKVRKDFTKIGAWF